VWALWVQLAASLRDDASPDRRFFHVRDASILAGEFIVGILPYWRVRLSDVSAWNLGRLEPRQG
jgi:hypothetical protein